MKTYVTQPASMQPNGLLIHLFCLHLVQHYGMQWNVTFCCDVAVICGMIWYGMLCYVDAPKFHTLYFGEVRLWQ